jgi:hypothetical protein
MRDDQATLLESVMKCGPNSVLAGKQRHMIYS